MNGEMMNMMKQPRCGMPDVYSEKSRFINFMTTQNKWKPKKLSYQIIGHSKKLPRNEVANTIRDAFNLWTSHIDLSFFKTSRRSRIKIGFYVGQHGDGNGFDGPGNVLAHASFPTGGLVHFDDEEIWDLNFNKSTVHLFQVAVHEIGHALGLDHSDQTGSIMWPFYNSETDFREGLHGDDINGIQFLYGPKTKPNNNNICENRKITSAVSYDNILYIFKNGKFATEKSPGVIKYVNDVWHDIDDHSKVLIADSKIYFFSGKKFWRFSGTTMDAGFPKKISERFLGIPNNIDAAVLINYQLYFFKGENFWVFNPLKVPRVSFQYPRLISSQFRGLPSGLESVIWSKDSNELYAIKDGEVYFYSLILNIVYLKENLSDYFMCSL